MRTTSIRMDDYQIKYIFFVEPTNKQSSNSRSQRNQRELRNDGSRVPFTSTIDQNVLGAAHIFNLALVCIHK